MAETRITTVSQKLYSLNYLLLAALVGLVLGGLIVWGWFISSARTASLAENRNDAARALPSVDVTTSVLPGSKATQTPASSSSTEPKKDDLPLPASGSSALTINNQPAGMIVEIAKTTVTPAQWVVIHEDRSGALGNVLGAARFLGGVSSGAVELLRGTSAGKTYYGVIYADNGDQSFSLADDTPLTDASGSVVGVTFKAQ